MSKMLADQRADGSLPRRLRYRLAARSRDELCRMMTNVESRPVPQRWRDLVTRMRVLVADEANIWEVLGYWLDGEFVVDCRWPPAACKAVLLHWFDAGLIECIATVQDTAESVGDVVEIERGADWRCRVTTVGEYLVLARTDAREILADVDAWSGNDAPSEVQVCATDAGVAADQDAWWTVLDGLLEDPI